MKKRKIRLYDTTLRDGAQGEGVSFSLKDKINICCKLDDLGIHYIEGGNPGSNPKDIEFFREVKKVKVKQAKITAFGSTRRGDKTAASDPNVGAILKAETSVVTIFGKSWILHVKEILRTSLKENLAMIGDTIAYFKKKGKEVIFDAEHFFDGYKDNTEYAVKTLEAAVEEGADVVVLCDTNGGTLPNELQQIVREVSNKISVPLGIHTHNDSGLAVANSLLAVTMGVSHVQGTINGLGERCGNADLCVIIPSLELKLGSECIGAGKLHNLQEISRYINEMANIVPDDKQPFVGISAFAHKGGMHVDAVRKNPVSFEHIEPSLVGNRRRVLVSELSGRSNILYKAAEFNIDLSREDPKTKEIVSILKQLESEGYQFEAAEGSLELLIRKSLGEQRRFFDLEGFRVSVEKREDNKLISEATIKVRVRNVLEHTAAEGDGPVHALDNALRKALRDFYPSLTEMHLTDFKVRVLDAKEGTAARVRVLIESQDHEGSWTTVGVSENIIEASWHALVDSIEYKLLKDKAK